MTDQLYLLLKRFPEGILIPQAVWHEVVESGKGQPGSSLVQTTPWITVCNIKEEVLVSLLNTELDRGESEAIALCFEHQVDIVLLDEKDARRIALNLGLSVLGTVGILIWAKRNGMISSLKEQLDALKINGNFRLGQAVYEKALNAVGESQK